MNKRKIAAIIAAASVIGCCAVSAGAEEANDGYVYFIAEKSVLGQGLTVEPVKVPYTSGEKGIDIVLKAAEIDYSVSDWGPYITGFADTDTGADVPEIIKNACADWGERNKEGYLSSYDYTAESGWNYFVNDAYASVGIGDYVPEDGDVIRFSFSVYGYGADIGIDNSSWGGAAALVTPAEKAELTKLCAEHEDKECEAYTSAIELLGDLTATQEAVDAAAEALIAEAPEEPVIGDSEITKEPAVGDTETPTDTIDPDDDTTIIGDSKPDEDSIEKSDADSPNTGVGGGLGTTALIAVIAGAAMAAVKLKKND